jgi:beta-phosphoglucomutase-like phosphatase (HAD superfamily)
MLQQNDINIDHEELTKCMGSEKAENISKLIILLNNTPDQQEEPQVKCSDYIFNYSDTSDDINNVVELINNQIILDDENAIQ